jgi:hypothetical protein
MDETVEDADRLASALAGGDLAESARMRGNLRMVVHGIFLDTDLSQSRRWRSS